MLTPYVPLALCLCVCHARESNNYDVSQSPLVNTNGGGQSATPSTKIAIIGAGMAGASAAHHIHQYMRLRSPPPNIVVYEADSMVGGRIKSVQVHGDSATFVEAGAVNFSEDDWCLHEAMQEVGLKPAKNMMPHHRTGIWDGQDFPLVYPSEQSPGVARSWWDSVKWWKRYGFALWQLQSMVKETTEKFESFALYQALRYLKKEIRRHDLDKEVANTLDPFLRTRHLPLKLIDEVLRAEARHRTSQDLEKMNALSALIAQNSGRLMSIHQGNQRLPHRMLKISEASVKLNTRVQTITPGIRRRWNLQVQHQQGPDHANGTASSEEFDIVILTPPFASRSITIQPLPTAKLEEKIEGALPTYVERHITLFTSLHRLSPIYFKQLTNFTLPENILTAPKPYLEDIGIFSITVVDMVPPTDSGDCVNELEYVYRILSNRHIPDSELLRLLDHGSMILEEKDNRTNAIYDQEEEGPPLITWVHRQVWPYARPTFNSNQSLLNNGEIAQDLFYTAASEDILSSMEMSCRMGHSVAYTLFYGNWVEEELIP